LQDGIPSTDNNLPLKAVFLGQKRASVYHRCTHASIKKLALVVCLLAIAVWCPAQEPDSTIKVDVKLVNVFVTVTDEHGRLSRA
jgi:hypothetical protein